ncbi:hypothetical protein ABE85_21200 [Mitsuaria sp. 7]|nr:hypothetical protein ABE85_21200 [Mitsuaria sp. 7]
MPSLRPLCLSSPATTAPDPVDGPKVDDTMVVVPDYRRGDRLHLALDSRMGTPGPEGGTGEVWRAPTGAELSKRTAPQAGNDEPLPGHLVDDRTLVLAAPLRTDASRIRLIGALMEHNVGLIVDLSTGQPWLREPHGLSENWQGRLPCGHGAKVWRLDTPGERGTPSCAETLRLELSLDLSVPAGSPPTRGQRAEIDVLELTTPLDRDLLPAEDAEDLVQFCRRFREEFPSERIAFLSVDGLGPAIALAGAERLCKDREADWPSSSQQVEERILQHARDLRERCGPLAIQPNELTTMADLAERLSVEPRTTPR